MAERETGSVKWFSSEKGYGFLVRDQGGDVFVHHTQIAGTGYRTLQEGQKVEFAVIQSEKGLQAQEVKVVE
jgi:CspA family cold shock protein